MAETNSSSIVAEIGETAGVVWRVLAEKGPLSVAQLVKAAGEPRDTVLHAIGWLAREDKVEINEQRRTRIVSLR